MIQCTQYWFGSVFFSLVWLESCQPFYFHLGIWNSLQKLEVGMGNYPCRLLSNPQILRHWSKASPSSVSGAVAHRWLNCGLMVVVCRQELPVWLRRRPSAGRHLSADGQDGRERRQLVQPELRRPLLHVQPAVPRPRGRHARPDGAVRRLRGLVPRPGMFEEAREQSG